MVHRLVDAAVEELHRTGYEGLSVRNVAKRAGVAPATAYTYFSSKDHLAGRGAVAPHARPSGAEP